MFDLHETGVTEVVRYTGANDFGVQVNPLIVEGQVHGGVVQGLGQVLFEEARYDEAAKHFDQALAASAGSTNMQ